MKRKKVVILIERQQATIYNLDESLCDLKLPDIVHIISCELRYATNNLYAGLTSFRSTNLTLNSSGLTNQPLRKRASREPSSN